MTEHENMPLEDEQAEGDQTIEDLDVPEGQDDDVAGGVGNTKWSDIEHR